MYNLNSMHNTDIFLITVNMAIAMAVSLWLLQKIKKQKETKH